MADYEVYLTPEAEVDLEEITAYIERFDSRERADAVFEGIKDAILKLESLPLRGRVTPELSEIGITDYRAVLYKAYRILYLVRQNTVHVFSIFDGRRDAEEVLSRRLLRNP